MKKGKLIIAVCILLSVLSLSACAKKVERIDGSGVAPDQLDTIKPDGIGSWAAIYEEGKEVLAFYTDGSAVYKDIKYDSYTIDDKFITFKSDEELKCRYLMKRKKMLLYDTKEYKRDRSFEEYKDVPDDSVVGYWALDENVSFEFTEKGSFYEDRNFPGYYIVNEDDHSIKLMYNDHFEDIYLYYEIDGDTMKLEYPWSLVQTVTK